MQSLLNSELGFFTICASDKLCPTANQEAVLFALSMSGEPAPNPHYTTCFLGPPVVLLLLVWDLWEADCKTGLDMQGTYYGKCLWGIMGNWGRLGEPQIIMMFRPLLRKERRLARKILDHVQFKKSLKRLMLTLGAKYQSLFFGRVFINQKKTYLPWYPYHTQWWLLCTCSDGFLSMKAATFSALCSSQSKVWEMHFCSHHSKYYTWCLHIFVLFRAG